MESFLDGVLWLPFQEPRFLHHGLPFADVSLPNFDAEDSDECEKLALLWDAKNLLVVFESPVVPGPNYDALVIDDYFSLSVSPVAADPETTFAHTSLEKARSIYAQEKLLGSVEKDVDSSLTLKAAGAEIRSSIGNVRLGYVPVGAPLSKRLALSVLSLRAACLPATTGKIASRLAGNWVSVLQYRKCFSCIIDDLFKTASACLEADPSLLFPLTRKVANELTMLATIAPLIFSNITARYHEKIYATDASNQKGAIVEAEVELDLQKALWLDADRKGGYTHLANGFNAILRQIGELDDDLEKETPSLQPEPIHKSPLMYFDFVEICGGAGKVGDSLNRLGFSVAPVLDLSESAHYDLCSLRLMEWVIYMLEEGRFRSFLVEPPCTTFSPAAHPAVRSYAEPLGFDRLLPKTLLGNTLAFRALCLLRVGKRCRRPCAAVNKVGSGFKRSLEALNSEERLMPDVDGLETILANEVMLSSSWRTRRSWFWKRQGHINVLELGSAVSNLVELSESAFSVRFANLVDSSVSRCALSKGRSASVALQPGLRRVCAVSVAADLYPAWTFSPTRLNCADDPTRDVPLRGPVPSRLLDGYHVDFLRACSQTKLRRFAANWLRLVLLASFLSEANACPYGLPCLGLRAPSGCVRLLACVLVPLVCLSVGMFVYMRRTLLCDWQDLWAPRKKSGLLNKKIRKEVLSRHRGALSISAMVFLCCMISGWAMPIGPTTAAERVRWAERFSSELTASRTLRPQTRNKRETYLLSFKKWLWDEKGTSFKHLVDQKPADPERVAALLVEYGRQLYHAGKAYGIYAETINAVACSRPLIKRQLTSAWDLAFSWLCEEPYDHNPAMPLSVMAAMAVVSLTWGWPHFAAVLMMSWAGVMRIGEVLAATRRELVLPVDCAPGTSFALIIIRAPKTRGRAANHQAARIDQEDIVSFLSAMYGGSPLETKIWPFSAATLRKRFADVLRALKLPTEKHGDQKPFSLGSMRPGGATWLLHQTENSEVVRRRGRWISVKVMEIYLQEVVMSVVLTTLQVSEAPVLESTGGQVADLTFNVVFFVEFLLRILSTPSKKLYLLDPLNLGDILSAFGLPLHASIGFVWSLEPRNSSRYQQVVLDLLLLFMPLARLLKLLRYFESFRLLVDAFAKSAEALPVLVFVTSFIVMLSGTLIYIVEDRSNIPTMPHYLWLALVTMTTVGYGDYFPKSIGGYLTVSVLTFTSVLFLALPVGIIGYEFTVSWQKRGEMYLKMRLRNSLAKWGYGIDDLEILFEYADVDDDGQLVLGEFIELIRQLRIGVNVESAAALFHLLDSDHNGMVDRGEFLRHIFPDEYAKHTQQITDETLSKSRRRIGVALERLESYNQIATAGLPVDPVPEEPFSLVLRSPNVTPERQESEAAALFALKGCDPCGLDPVSFSPIRALVYLPAMVDSSEKFEVRSLSAAAPATSAEVNALAEQLDLRLERLTEKMDICIEEVMQLKRGPRMSTFQGRGSMISAAPRSSLSPSPPASPKGRTLAGQSAAGGDAAAFSSLRGSTCKTPSSGDRSSFVVSARPLSTRGLKDMDLDVARRLHAQEVCQDIKAMNDPDMKPFLRMVTRSRADIVWELLDDPRSSKAAWLISQFLKFSVVFSVGLTTYSISEEVVLQGFWRRGAQITFDVVFFLEFLLRFLSAPSKKSYLSDPLNWGDFLSAMGLPVLCFIGFSQSVPETRTELRVQQFLLLFLPLARFLKLLRYFESFRLLVDAFAKSAEALPVLTYIMAFIVLLFGTSIYVQEDRSNIPSMPHCMWLALVTMTTVGYGDYFPISMGGYLTVSALTFVSVLFLALPGFAAVCGIWLLPASMSLAPALKDALQKALDDGSKGLLGKWKNVLDVLLANNVAFHAKLSPNSLLVHPQNRGGSGVQPFHMHQKGSKIVETGAAMDLLIGSVCFEMHPNDGKRKEQLEFNQKLIAASSDLMSPILGGERYLTASSTHTSQFCRALAHGCKTPEPSLKDSNGNLSLEMLGKDAVLKEMATVGWNWVVIPWYVEEAFPKLPAMIADALTSVNGIFEAQGELELALTIANAAKVGTTFDWDKMASQCCISPQVAGYAKCIGKLVKNLGGGKDEGYPLIKFAQEFQKQFGGSCFVGKDFFTTLVDTDLVPTNMTVFVKIAILATQVSCPEGKRADNFYRYLTKGDIQSLRSKKKQPLVMEAENMLSECWGNMTGPNVEANDRTKIFGRLCLRTTLHLLGKEKSGRDTTQFPNLQEIKAKFEEEMKTGCLQQPSKEDSSPPKTADAVSLQDGQNPMFMAGLKVPLTIGSTYSHKDYANVIFTLDKVDATHAHLSSKDLVTNQTTSLKLDGSEVMDKVKATKQKEGIVVSGDALANAFPSVKCQDELTKSKVYQELFDAYEANDTDESFIQCVVVPGKGIKVFAMKPMKKHELVLVPMTEHVNAIHFSEPKSKVFGSGKFNGAQFWVLPPKIGKEPADSTLVPFFLMKEIENGQMVPFQLEHGKLKVLALRNGNAIQKHDEIGLEMADGKEPPAKKKRT
eukprot:s392_g19.t1